MGRYNLSYFGSISMMKLLYIEASVIIIVNTHDDGRCRDIRHHGNVRRYTGHGMFCREDVSLSPFS